MAEDVAKAGTLLKAAATTLSLDEKSDTNLRRIAASLIREAKTKLRSVLDGIGIENCVDADVSSDVYRLYSQVLVLASVLSRDEAVDGEDICDFPEVDALELASEFAGTDAQEGLSFRFQEMAYEAWRTVKPRAVKP